MALGAEHAGPRHGPLLRCGQGDPSTERPGLRRAQERLWRWRPVPWSDRDANQNRACKGERRAAPRLCGKRGILMFRRAAPAIVCVALVFAAIPLSSAQRKFYDDDPISREPETQDASKAQAREIDLLFDLSMNLFGRPGDATDNVRARNINTIDEVPDSSWFTNRILARPVSVDEASRGPLTGTGPAPGPWTIIRDKDAGAAPGFRIRDSKGVVWFVSLDARGYPEAATSAIVVANKIFWA